MRSCKQCRYNPVACVIKINKKITKGITEIPELTKELYKCTINTNTKPIKWGKIWNSQLSDHSDVLFIKKIITELKKRQTQSIFNQLSNENTNNNNNNIHIF